MVKDISNNSYMQSPAISDYRQIKQFVQQKEQQVESLDKKLSFAALEALPPARRISSLPEKFKNNEYLSAAGLGALAIINLPEDLRDIKKATQQVNDKVLSKNTKEYLKKNHNKFFKNFVEYDELYKRKEYQHSFSFFRGTLLDNKIAKGIDDGKKWAKTLYELDNSIYKTKFGKFVQNKLGIEIIERQRTQIKNAAGITARASKFSGGFFKQMTGSAMKRLPLLSVVALGIIEMPRILKSHKKGNNVIAKTDEVAKQTVKSGVNVASLLAGIGYGGAIGQRFGGAFGSLVGMGAGAILGAEGSQRLQELIG